MHRVRALSQNEQIGYWTPLNPLFKEYIDILQGVCGLGVAKTNLSNYVTREDNFEIEYASKVCFISPQIYHKQETLSGYVGKGKTTFINYIREKIIHYKYPHIVTLYIDITSLSNNYTKLFQERTINTIELKIQKIFKITSFQLMSKYLEFNGYDLNKIQSISNEYKNHVTYHQILIFLDFLCKESHQKIIIFFDNIDENNRETVTAIRYLIRELNSFFSESFNYTSTLIITSVRDYNKRFFNQNFQKTYQVPDVPLPEAEFAGVVKSKLIEIKDEIQKASNTYSQYIYIGRYYRTPAKTTITKESLVNFLSDLIDILFKEDKPIITYLHSLSAGNLKILSSNILNILQSKNLPLINLFDYKYNPETKFTKDNIKISKNELIQCLMAIRFPYYDIEASNILNVFNINSSHNRLDFYNVLGISRMLFYIYNNRNFDITFLKIRQEMEKIKYHTNTINTAIDKCFGKGLFQTKFGISLSQIDQENDYVKLGICGKEYVSDLIFQFSYLQYVCEDTPVSPDNIVPINKKYYKDNEENAVIERDFKNNRIKSVELFVDFLEKMEDLELAEMAKIGIDKEMYLFNYSYRENGEGIKLSSKIRKEVSKVIDRIE